MQSLQYLSGFGNTHLSEARPGALPREQNSPQKAPFGLYAEQFSVSAFTAPRHENRRSWLYKIRPSVVQESFQPLNHPTATVESQGQKPTNPNQLRWSPIEIASQAHDFVDGLVHWLSNPVSNVFLYTANRSMTDRFFYDSDGELLIVPQEGEIIAHTECGVLNVAPGSILVIPRGMKFRIALASSSARGYVCENKESSFRLPELGPIGANGLANGRDFEVPVAQFEDREGKFALVTKFEGHFFSAQIGHSPLDSVAWYGNAFPYRYNLSRFNTIGTVSFDHPDPSIFTVLTAPSERTGVANIDFVVFPPRWMVAEHTFRPPYFHRNVMSEYMGLITGAYDAKATGFLPGGGSLHNCMIGHGPDRETYEKASTAQLKPEHYANTMAFMFESRFVFHPSKHALEGKALQRDYAKCWQDLKREFR